MYQNPLKINNDTVNMYQVNMTIEFGLYAPANSRLQCFFMYIREYCGQSVGVQMENLIVSRPTSTRGRVYTPDERHYNRYMLVMAMA